MIQTLPFLALLGLAGLPGAFAQVGPANVTCTDNANDQGNYTSSTGAVFKILCGVDYAGGDLSATTTNTFADCIEACATTSGCVDVSYGGNACYLKNQLETSVSKDWVWTAQLVKNTASAGSVPGANGNQLTCDNKQSEGTNYTTSSGLTFEVLCGVDYAGGDLAAANSATFESCIETCANTTGCIDVSYVAPSCYMKSQLGTPENRDWVWTAKQVVASTPSTSNALSCDNNASDGQTYQAGNDTFLITCGKDYAGGDLLGLSAATFEDCINACDSNAQCVNVAYVHGACYLKQQQEPAVNNTAVWGAIRQQAPGTTSTTSTTAASTSASTSSTATTSSTPTATPLSCDNDASNGTQYTSTKNGKYLIVCGVDYGGNDLVGTTTDSFEDCIAACDNNTDCVDVSYVAPSCYLKKALGDPSQVGYVWTAKQFVAPGASTTTTTTFEILSAIYGVADITAYATQTWLVNNTIQIDTGALTGDPYAPDAASQDPLYGSSKSIFLLYRVTTNGTSELRSWVGADSLGVVTIDPNLPVDAAPPSSMDAAAWNPPAGTPASIQILEVAYGLLQIRNAGAWDTLYEDAASGSSTPAENNVFSDTWYGTVKSAVVWFRYLSDGAGGAVHAVVAEEHGAITLPGPGATAANKARAAAKARRRRVGGVLG